MIEVLTSSIDQAALDKLASYHWPGNVRELKHVIERAFILADEAITSEHLILEASEPTQAGLESIPAGVPIEQLEQIAIEKTLTENEGNKTDTAEQLGISVKTLYNKLEKYQAE